MHSSPVPAGTKAKICEVPPAGPPFGSVRKSKAPSPDHARALAGMVQAIARQ
jgi:hypothetical protein